MKLLIFFICLFVSGIVFGQEAYVNPVDGKTYIADWKKYKAEGKTEPQEGRVVNAGVRLLSTQEDFGRNISAKDLAKLISYTQELLTIEIGSAKEAGEVLLQISLNKDKSPEYKMAYQGELSQDLLQRFYNRLKKIELNTKENSVTFQVNFKIKNA